MRRFSYSSYRLSHFALSTGIAALLLRVQSNCNAYYDGPLSWARNEANWEAKVRFWQINWMWCFRFLHFVHIRRETGRYDDDLDNQF